MAEQATRVVNGLGFPARAFAFTPKPTKPSTWKLRLFDTPADVAANRPSVRLTAAAAMALSPSGFRGNRVRLPAAVKARVRRKVAAAWKKARGGSRAPSLPNSLKVAKFVTTAPTQDNTVDADFIDAVDWEDAERICAERGLGESVLGEVVEDELAVPQAKDDLGTAGLQAGGALQPAQGRSLVRTLPKPVVDTTEEDKIGKAGGEVAQETATEHVGVFMRVPTRVADGFPERRGQDESPPHATILQAGEMERGEFDKFLLAARVLLKQVPPVRVELTDFGQFTSHKGDEVPHVIPRMKTHGLTFERLHEFLCSEMRDLGFEGCRRDDPFKPHVTLDILPPGSKFSGDVPGGEFALTELEVWGDHGGEFGRYAIELGTGKVLRRVDSLKRGSELAAPQVTEAEVQEDAPREFRILTSKADGEERTVFGIVLEPEVVDSQDDIYSPEEIRKTAYRFMERYQQFGLMHRDMVSSILPLECYLAPCDFEAGGQKVLKGTWLLRVRVLDDKIWGKVRSGELTGFSIGGSAMRTPDTVKLA